MKPINNSYSAEPSNCGSAQVERYAGVQIKNEKGELVEPVQNDMDVLHNLTSSKIVDFANRMAYNAKGEEIINFGKHNGKRVVDVLAQEPSYYDWMMKGDFTLDTKRKLTEIKMRMAFGRK